MKKQSMYTRLKDQFNKCVQKTIKHGRFYSKSTTSLKQLGMGLVACATLGMSTPAMAQYTPPEFVIRRGADNPIEEVYRTGVAGGHDGRVAFVSSSTNVVVYSKVDSIPVDTFAYKVDGARTAFFISPIGTNYGEITQSSPFIFVSELNLLDSTFYHLNDFAQVDIDGDGDLDLFSGARSKANYELANSPNPGALDLEPCHYYENVGVVSTLSGVSVYARRTGSDNPLNMANALFISDANVTSSNLREFVTAFADLDDDGDFDCIALEMGETSDDNFATQRNQLVFYENQGDAQNPNFVRSPGVGIGSQINNVIASKNVGTSLIDLIDIDGDNDYDILLHNDKTSTEAITNEGDSTNLNLNSMLVTNPAITNNIMKSIYQLEQDSLGPNEHFTKLRFIDFDNDGDLDAFNRPTYETIFSLQEAVYLENVGPPMLNNNIIETEEIAKKLNINPNPIQGGTVSFDKAMTGIISIYDLTGKTVLTKKIEEEISFDVSALKNGMYIISLEAENEIYQEKVLIER